MIGRRGFITGLVSLVAAPAIVRVASIMPVKVMEFDFTTYGRYIIKLDPIDVERYRHLCRPNCAHTIKWLTENKPRIFADSEFHSVERIAQVVHSY